MEGFADRLIDGEAEGPIRWTEIELQVWGVSYDHHPVLPQGVLIARERFPVAR